VDEPTNAGAARGLQHSNRPVDIDSLESSGVARTHESGRMPDYVGTGDEAIAGFVVLEIADDQLMADRRLIGRTRKDPDLTDANRGESRDHRRADEACPARDGDDRHVPPAAPTRRARSILRFQEPGSE
jgi:hypothetical protein